VRRGGLVTAALQGEQSRPRPALVIQADGFAGSPALTVPPITGTLTDAPLMRVLTWLTLANGLAKQSQVMMNKLQIPLRTSVGSVFGYLDNSAMLAVNHALAVFPGLA